MIRLTSTCLQNAAQRIGNRQSSDPGAGPARTKQARAAPMPCDGDFQSTLGDSLRDTGFSLPFVEGANARADEPRANLAWPRPMALRMAAGSGLPELMGGPGKAGGFFGGELFHDLDPLIFRQCAVSDMPWRRRRRVQEDGRNPDRGVFTFPVTPLAAGCEREARLAKVFEEAADFPWHRETLPILGGVATSIYALPAENPCIVRSK